MANANRAFMPEKLKTTGGKITSASRPQRTVQIYRAHNDQSRHSLIAVRSAISLKNALQMYYEESLKERRYSKPIFKGNTMSVISHVGKKIMYIAKDA